MSISNIDDVLLGTKSNIHPETPENQRLESEGESEHEYETEDYGVSEEDSKKDLESDRKDAREADESIGKREIDDYGNETLTENEVLPENEVIRERLARQARKHQAEIDALRAQLQEQGASREVQKAAKDFEYDPEASGDWQQQLASFVKQTVNNMSREESERQQQLAEVETQRKFESKFHDGMSKFEDFKDVMMGLEFEITNPMTLATRAMDNPAAFLYAAAKRQPKELERISKIRDPYAQMTEMGRLEERMRKNKAATTAPRPLGRTPEDSTTREVKKSKEPSIEDLIRQSEAKKIAKLRTRPVRR
jgi:hypothetical protein